MSMIEYAESEMQLAGFDDDDADYGPDEIKKCVMDLVKVFTGQGHSEGSAALVLSVFDRVVRFKPLGPLTAKPEEWMHVCDDDGEQRALWQSKRDPEAFSHDGGKTWYHL